MTFDASADVIALYELATRSPLPSLPENRDCPIHDREAIQGLLPHRPPFLFLDRITGLDRATSTVFALCDLERSQKIVSGHFPGYPVWPAVLQVEAIAQAGLCAASLLGGLPEKGASPQVHLITHILAARFMRSVDPSEELEIVARTLSDGLFDVIVGQCLQRDQICSVAAVKGLTQEVGT